MDTKSKQNDQDITHPSSFNLGEFVLSKKVKRSKKVERHRSATSATFYKMGDHQYKVPDTWSGGPSQPVQVQYVSPARPQVQQHQYQPQQEQMVYQEMQTPQQQQQRQPPQYLVIRPQQQQHQQQQQPQQHYVQQQPPLQQHYVHPQQQQPPQQVQQQYVQHPVPTQHVIVRRRPPPRPVVQQQHQQHNYVQQQQHHPQQQQPANAEQNLVTKVQEENDQLKNELKILKESQNELKKSFQDLTDLVMSQNQNKPQNDQETTSNNGSVENENQNSAGSDNTDEPYFENPFEFERPLKKIKLEDQSEEIQKLNQVIKDLKEGNLKLQKEVAKLSKANDDYEEVQKQNEAIIKNLKEENLKLHQEILDLK